MLYTDSSKWNVMGFWISMPPLSATEEIQARALNKHIYSKHKWGAYKAVTMFNFSLDIDLPISMYFVYLYRIFTSMDLWKTSSSLWPRVLDQTNTRYYVYKCVYIFWWVVCLCVCFLFVLSSTTLHVWLCMFHCEVKGRGHCGQNR